MTHLSAAIPALLQDAVPPIGHCAVSTHPTQGRTPKVLSCCNHRQAEVPDKLHESTSRPATAFAVPSFPQNHAGKRHTHTPHTHNTVHHLTHPFPQLKTATLEFPPHPKLSKARPPPESPQSHHEVKARNQCIRAHNGSHSPPSSHLTPLRASYQEDSERPRRVNKFRVMNYRKKRGIGWGGTL